MKPIASKTLKVIQYFKDHPNAPVKKVAEKFQMALPKVYALRKRAYYEEVVAIAGQVPPVPETPGETFQSALPMVNALNKVDDILDTRATQYGTFADGASLMQSLKRTLAAHAQAHDKTFADDQWESLEMIVHKMARIVNGNPDNVDSWRDIAGYATLVADRLEGNAR